MKRSDFAQKLLDDLRLRKERMNASQKSGQSNQLPIDAYAYSKQTYRGSRNTKASQNVSSRTGDMLNRSSRSHRSAKVGEASNQIVLYGRGQSSGPISDKSQALGFAFENGGKLRRNDSSFTSSIMGFLSQLTRGTLNLGKMERRSNSNWQLASASHFPALSPLQINEIYKGAQKLNQILRASSNNGLTIDRHSIEFAKELLQGAINLEESLRMLVDLQKNSEFMVTPQKKNRIILLEDDNDEDEDDDNKTIASLEQKQLAPPIFSFDKASKHSQNLQGNKTSIVRRPITPNYSKGKKLNTEKQDVNTSNLFSHKRSTSYSSNIKNLNTLSNQSNQSASVQSNPEKSRIPNVIAKLMGLDNLPEKVEVKYTQGKDLCSTQTMEGSAFKRASKGTATKIELMSKQTDNLWPQKKQKVIEATTMPATKDKELMFGADKNLNMWKASSEVVAHNGVKALKGLDKTTIQKDKQRDSTVKANFIKESLTGAQEKGRRQESANNKEQKGTGKGRTNDLLLNNMLNQMEQHERSEVKSSQQEEKETNGSIHQLEKRHTNKHISSNQKVIQNHLGIKKSKTVFKYGPQEEKHHREQRHQQSENHVLQARPQKRSETTFKNLSNPPHELISSPKKQHIINQVASLKPKSAENIDAMNLERFPISYYDDPIRDEVSIDLNVQVKKMMNKELGKGRTSILKMMDEKSIHKIVDKKVKTTLKQNKDMAGKIDKVLTRRNGTILCITKQKQEKQSSPILQQVTERTSDKINVSKEVKQERSGIFKEADAHIISSNAPVAITEPLEVRQQLHKEDELPPTLFSPDGGEHQSPQEPLALVPSDLHQGAKSVVISDLHDQATFGAVEKEFKSCEIAPYDINGMRDDRMDINSHLQLQDQNISLKSPKPLTESENSLKWNLINSQLFLNTAETLFRLDIPFSIPQGGGQDNQDLGSKLILDCGYEVMKRKGIRQEFKVHPCSEISISAIRIRSLDDLVKQLNKDMEKLTFYGRSRMPQANVEDYLPKMLENDVYNKDPDINCMWELGWNDETFAFIEKYDAIRNMEKHVLNGLLDEITRDLWPFQGGLNKTTTNTAA